MDDLRISSGVLVLWVKKWHWMGVRLEGKGKYRWRMSSKAGSLLYLTAVHFTEGRKDIPVFSRASTSAPLADPGRKKGI